jgi:hypothetical protein
VERLRQKNIRSTIAQLERVDNFTQSHNPNAYNYLQRIVTAFVMKKLPTLAPHPPTG